MFHNARNFNQDISSWNVSKVNLFNSFSNNSKIDKNKKYLPKKFISKISKT